MKWILNGLGVILTLAGLVWLLQGMNILRGSVMSGASQWTIIGLICVIVGVGLLAYMNLRGRSAKQAPR